MKLQTKKVIAKEFLILMIVIAAGFIGFLFTYPYNLYRTRQIANLDVVIKKKQKTKDSLNQLIIDKDPFVKYGGALIHPPPDILDCAKKVNKLQTQIEKFDSQKTGIETEKLSFDEQGRFGMRMAVVLLILLFGFRYLFYAVRWSIKTLKL